MAELNDGIARFLPRYPNIVPDRDNLLNPYDGDFYSTIYKKKEFYDLRLEKVEEFPDRPGVLMNHQKIIARYLSSHTPYDGVLLFHEMGTGKTCSAIGAIEQVKSEGKFKGAIYIGSKTLSDNFLRELVEVCTSDEYKRAVREMADPDEKRMTALQRKIRYKKAVGGFYKLGSEYTYQQFARKKIGNLSDDEIRKRYNNHVIVIDEVHNLAEITNKETGKGKNPRTYERIWNFLHTIQGCKVLLLSGTPMRNKVSDIASVMNLILPKKEQLPTGTDFVKNHGYFMVSDKDLYLLTTKGKNRLKEAFKGRVSYLRAITSDVERKFIGTNITVPGLKHSFKVSESIMSSFQTRGYNMAWERDHNSSKDKSGYYLNSRQASLFVFPSTSGTDTPTWGSEGFQKYITKTQDKRHSLFKKKKGGSKYNWTESGKKLRREIAAGGIPALAKYSCKYAATCKILKKAIEDKKLVFIFNEAVEGGGIILFSLILKALKYKRVSKPPKKNNNKTFAILTGNTSNISALINSFNQPDNFDGSRINIIIGSQAVGEGVSLKNVQVEIVQTPWFNYARIDQALARGYRFGSHNLLKRTSGSKIVQDIYQQVAIPLESIASPSSPGPPPDPESTLSVDLDMYLTAQKKDISFKRIERVMRSSAFDCALTYKRNIMSGRDNSRECDYTNCEYTCDGPKLNLKEYGSESRKLTNEMLDYTTYQLYYDHDKMMMVISNIVELFSDDRFLLSLNEIQEFLGTSVDNNFELLQALNKIISNSIPIRNRYGFTSYLQEDNDVYFLVDSLSIIGLSSMAYYTKYPDVRVKQSFAEIKEKYFTNVAIPRAIQDLCRVEGDIRPYIRRLPVGYKEMFLENSLKARIYKGRGGEFNTEQVALAEKILKYFKLDIHIGEGRGISSLLKTSGGPLRCIDTTTDTLEWHDCDQKEEEAFNKRKVRNRQRLEQELFYGQFNEKDREFCIRDMRGGVDIGGHKLTAGARCRNGYNHWVRIYILTFTTTMPVPPTPETITFILSNKCGPPVEKHDFSSSQKNEIKSGNVKVNNKTLLIPLNMVPVSTSPRIKSKVYSIPLGNKSKLQEYLLLCVKAVKGGTSNATMKRWFKEGKDIFLCLLERGGGSRTDTKSKKWKAVEIGVKKMTVPEMERLIYYGSLKTVAQCAFLCSWYHDNNLLVPDPYCGSGSKPKPKGGSTEDLRAHDTYCGSSSKGSKKKVKRGSKKR